MAIITHHKAFYAQPIARAKGFVYQRGALFVALFVLCFCAMIAAFFFTSAARAVEDSQLLDCMLTPSISRGGVDYPGAENIIPSNRLAQPAGKVQRADGQPVLLIGRITDERCVPITDAKIELWQPNPSGEFKIATAEELANPYPVFAGTGRAKSDNLGRYGFSTLFPGPLKGNAPRLILRISHPEFETLSTVVYFAGDARNAKDAIYKGLSDEQRQRLTAEPSPVDSTNPDAGLNLTFNITLRGKQTFRRF